MGENGEDAPGRDAPDATFITRVVLKNYKSIAACDVALGPLTFLVGPNGSGKSNFLDALRFISDALSRSLDHAIRERGGINEVRRRAAGRSSEIGVCFDLRFWNGTTGRYALTLRGSKAGSVEVVEEVCELMGRFGDLADGHADPYFLGNALKGQGQRASFRVHEDDVWINGEGMVLSPIDGLFLRRAPAREFQIVASLLESMRFLNPAPQRLKTPLVPDASPDLLPDGRNVTSVIRGLTRNHPDIADRIGEYLRAVLPGLDSFRPKSLGDWESLEFRMRSGSNGHAVRFSPLGMSDGTLRALLVLTALFQTRPRGTIQVPLVGIEEPEIALHPAGAGVLLDALGEASEHRQILATTHSADLLHRKDVNPDSILAVVSDEGGTQIGPIDDVGRSVLRDRLYTVGDLLRMDQLKPAPSAPKRGPGRRPTTTGAA